MRTVGVEEELLIVSARTGEVLALSTVVISPPPSRKADKGTVREFEKELQKEQVEFATNPLVAMSDVEEEIIRRRREAAARAEEAGATVAALATSPVPVQPSLHLGERHIWMAENFGLTTREQLTCGCHVHVAVESDDEGVAVLDRIRPWLSVLTAISGNSPFWQGEDSGYSSYRSRVWNRWPSAGPTEIFGSAERYHRHVDAMLATGALRDDGMIYFDARLSARYPTVEVRVADVCLQPSTTVLIAALVRGLVETAAASWRAGQPPAPVSAGLLRLASWRAARSGLTGSLVDPLTMREKAASDVVAALLAHVEDALSDSGDLERARHTLAQLTAHGTGADRQREIYREHQSFQAVVRECARITALAD
ncbi:glutamate--cysteine ligase [Streptomyces violascens]|uniref:Putative glutamate--cysteine ligase 2 n=1 Tax=Streptomyces violascens TaxID=67381 RepID=A0ABQ3QTN4_9ACTN|nr:glutamate--cysteine ligase [Streptomyces violascens]GHI40641.1 putative glutamate--cysteine ligase 2 [Streptomyces violascens]